MNENLCIAYICKYTANDKCPITKYPCSLWLNMVEPTKKPQHICAMQKEEYM